MYIAIAVVLLLVLAAFLYTKQAKFGKAPSGARLALMQTKPNFKDGVFENLIETPSLAEDASYFTVLMNFMKKRPNAVPSHALKSIKTDLHALSADAEVLVWFGHSSYFIQTGGKRFLIDPVFSDHASPFPNSVKAFPISHDYGSSDMPEIDFLIITHDHWDHLDYPTVMELKPKVKHVVTGLGVGEHFESWGFDGNSVTELYWGEDATFGDVKLTAAPARHFSGRWLKRNITLWSSFVLKTPTRNLYLGGDSGYGPHFKEIGEKYGPFDLAILDNGQYNQAWKYIHMLPDEVIAAARDLGSARLFPVHSSKFALATHDWNEPLTRIQLLADSAEQPIITPMIGQPVELANPNQQFQQWWLED